jgi:hypothetical protein
VKICVQNAFLCALRVSVVFWGFQQLGVDFASRRFKQPVRVEVSLGKEGREDRTRNHHRNQHREPCLVDDSCLVAERLRSRARHRAGTGAAL